MSLFEIFAALVTIAAAFSYVNHRFLKLPTTIGLMAMALVLSLLLLAAGGLSPSLVSDGRRILGSIDFSRTLMQGMLGFLLFAGSLHVNLDDLRRQRGVVSVLATAGVLVSTLLVGGMAWAVLNPLLGLDVGWGYCLLFGALVSPTDPIAVLGILKQLGAPKTLEAKIAGESLFNDGVAVVVFLAIAGWLGFGHGGHGEVSALSVLHLFTVEAGGGVAFGLLSGGVAFLLLRSVDNYQVEILISLALVAGGYATCDRLGVSGPIAMVVAGLLIGNHGRTLAMSASTREHLDTFWELVDEILNAVLFVLLGFEVLVLTFTRDLLLTGLLMIPVVVLARWLAVGGTLGVMRRWRAFSPHAVKILTWGGLRGGISVALALS
ncbi:MAG: sodium:proton antiporter, partial [Acidobacteria bacterium]|nr:sodium:proton antiporter [Acidobacteriota bacterium]